MNKKSEDLKELLGVLIKEEMVSFFFLKILNHEQLEKYEPLLLDHFWVAKVKSSSLKNITKPDEQSDEEVHRAIFPF